MVASRLGDFRFRSPPAAGPQPQSPSGSPCGPLGSLGSYSLDGRLATGGAQPARVARLLLVGWSPRDWRGPARSGRSAPTSWMVASRLAGPSPLGSLGSYSLDGRLATGGAQPARVARLLLVGWSPRDWRGPARSGRSAPTRWMVASRLAGPSPLASLGSYSLDGRLATGGAQPARVARLLLVGWSPRDWRGPARSGRSAPTRWMVASRLAGPSPLGSLGSYSLDGRLATGGAQPARVARLLLVGWSPRDWRGPARSRRSAPTRWMVASRLAGPSPLASLGSYSLDGRLA